MRRAANWLKRSAAAFAARCTASRANYCDCGARVHELYTCRFCGTAYARAYTDDVDSPSALWSEPGRRLRMEEGETSPLLPLDMLLEAAEPDASRGTRRLRS